MDRSSLSATAMGRGPGFLRDERGAAAVEFALVVPVLLLLVFGMIDFGRLLFTRNNLQSAVREGARVAAARPNPTDGVARDRVVAYINAAEQTHIAPDMVSVTYDPATGLITVGIPRGYPFRPITPFASNLGLASFDIRPQAVFRWEMSS
jgi:Flp pilus assembly protein TadG